MASIDIPPPAPDPSGPGATGDAEHEAARDAAYDELLQAARPVVDLIDPTLGVCAIVVGDFVDLTPQPVEHDDLIEIVLAAMGAGEVPIGPLAYLPGDPQFEVSPDGRTARATMGTPEVTTVLGALHLEPTRVIVGGSRYGWIPDAGCVPAHVLLPDLESVLAEARVYVTRRAAQRGYRGDVRIRVLAHAEVPGESIVPRRLDETTGELLPAQGPVDRIAPVSFVYSLADSVEQTRRTYYAAACRLAAEFGASAPQFIADPDSDISDDLPVGPAA